jgi:predicted ATPase
VLRARAGTDTMCDMLRSSPWAGPFVGRAPDLREVSERFARGAHLVTVVGPGGVGKTRFARRFCEIDPASEGGAAPWFCELAEATDIETVCDELARVGRSMGATSDPTGDRVVALGAMLARRESLLVVLDNCEQVLESVALLLGRWLALAPSVRWLATSREPLRLAAEQVHDLGPLAPPGPRTEGAPPLSMEEIARADAVALFVDRARAARAGYALGESDAGAVAAIVTRLDGLPLAIELAAARMSVMDAHALLARLGSGLDLIAGGPRDAPDRHRTMRAIVAWSWALLEPWEATALRQCSVFRGGFTIEAGERVVDLSAFPAAPPVLDVLQSLRQKSLLRAYDSRGSPNALRLALYDVVRAFADEELARHAGEEAGARERHARHFLRAGEQWRSQLDAGTTEAREAAQAALSGDHENLLAMHAWALEAARGGAPPGDALRAMLAIEPTLRQRGSFRLQLALLDETLALQPTGEARGLRVLLLLSRSSVHVKGGRRQQAEGDAREALELAEISGDTALRGRALFSLSTVAEGFGRMQEAQVHMEEAVSVLETTSSSWRPAALGGLAGIRSEQGRLDEALVLYERAVVARGEEEGEADWAVYCDFAMLLLELGRDEEAGIQLDRALTAAKGGPSDVRAAVARYRGAFSHAEGHVDEAIARYREGMRECPDMGQYLSTLALGALGAALAAAGRTEEASRALDEADSPARGEQASVVVSLHRGHLDLARARSAAEAGDEEGSARLVDLARARLTRAEADGRGSSEVRVAALLLRGAIDRVQARHPNAQVLRVGPEAAWFVVPGIPKVHLGRKHRLRRLLSTLVRTREASPGTPLDVNAVCRAVWPGERVLAHAAKRRVHVAVSTLRAMGMRDVLLSEGDGYLLDPRVDLEVSPSPKS